MDGNIWTRNPQSHKSQVSVRVFFSFYVCFYISTHCKFRNELKEQHVVRIWAITVNYCVHGVSWTKQPSGSNTSSFPHVNEGIGRIGPALQARKNAIKMLLCECGHLCKFKSTSCKQGEEKSTAHTSPTNGRPPPRGAFDLHFVSLFYLALTPEYIETRINHVSIQHVGCSLHLHLRSGRLAFPIAFVLQLFILHCINIRPFNN